MRRALADRVGLECQKFNDKNSPTVKKPVTAASVRSIAPLATSGSASPRDVSSAQDQQTDEGDNGEESNKVDEFHGEILCSAHLGQAADACVRTCRNSVADTATLHLESDCACRVQGGFASVRTRETVSVRHGAGQRPRTGPACLYNEGIRLCR